MVQIEPPLQVISSIDTASRCTDALQLTYS